MGKVDVWNRQTVSYPAERVEIKDGEETFVFWLKKQDTFDRARVDELTGQLCDAYLGPVKRRDKRTSRAIERGDPLQQLPVMGDEPVQLNEIVLGYIAGVGVMQDWSGHKAECYNPEELIAIAAAWPDTWSKLLEAAGEINSGGQGNDSSEGVADGSGPLSSI